MDKYKEVIQALEKAIKVLEKQIPYKVDEKHKAISGMMFGLCKCGMKQAYYDKYCSNCGQRIDWS